MSFRRMAVFLTLSVLAVACDKDDDGLSNSEEKELGKVRFLQKHKVNYEMKKK